MVLLIILIGPIIGGIYLLINLIMGIKEEYDFQREEKQKQYEEEVQRNNILSKVLPDEKKCGSCQYRVQGPDSSRTVKICDREEELYWCEKFGKEVIENEHIGCANYYPCRLFITFDLMDR
jgi:hypothetical protein